MDDDGRTVGLEYQPEKNNQVSVVEDSSVETSNVNSPANQSGANTPASQSGANTPANQSGANTPVNRSGANTPVSQSGAKKPKDIMSMCFPGSQTEKSETSVAQEQQQDPTDDTAEGAEGAEGTDEGAEETGEGAEGAVQDGATRYGRVVKPVDRLTYPADYIKKDKPPRCSSKSPGPSKVENN